MALIAGNQFVKDLEQAGALAMVVPPEGGFEGRYQRRLRSAGYTTLHLSAPGLGDLSSYLTQVHGVRPAHTGKEDIRVYFRPPLVNYHLEQLPANSKGLVLWLIDGKKLSQQEFAYLALLPTLEPRVKVVIEVGGDRQVGWKPLSQVAAA
ncbi:NAD(P)H-quinone oxidoreductase subunit N [Candidatus Synechococcus calcipolaris G9]|uniref:NAD(P)H-quinone oxidoreductase subunit N n=1 Tax=Candidatus Synechococcus calcipolaris G9 TaxID=1497997 RepID=A0ABT6EWS4_9SYNE|nr:NAD(P)H-quinone oxidoreductase subunit N [Candidatus Synechococcus calcipolaris]MDG2989812.1 NAD(P)H-quinone oxidoreductase subunit N [Candidatus Synechococcus calcipolaris G9]